MKRALWVSAAMLAVMSVTGWAGPKWTLSDDSWIQFGLLGQVHGSYLEGAADEEDFYLRRGRLIFSGQMMEGVKFFVETDNDNAGRNGYDAVSTDIQDAFVDVQVAEDQWLKAGLILLPFSFETRASAASLLGMDYNSEVVKMMNTFTWRDYGAEFQGSLWKRVRYGVGVFDGYDAKDSIKNAGAGFRTTGHVAVNVVGDVETGWFYTQERLDKTYVALGAGGDMQDEATSITPALPKDAAADAPTPAPVIQDSTAWVVDMQSGAKFSENVHGTLNGAYYEWENAKFEGSTAFVEGGLGYSKVMGTLKWAVQDPDEGESTEDMTVGLHYFHKGHNLRTGVEYRFGDSDDWVLAGLQFLL